MTTPVVGFAGMTHLGLNMAAAVAERGFATLAFDPDPGLVDRIEQGELPVVEDGLQELIDSNKRRLSFTADGNRLQECDLVYVAPDVPTDSAGGSNLAPIRALLDLTTGHARPEALLVVLSQVPPGFTRSVGWDSARLFYQVETLIFGRAVERALHPERFIVGCSEPSAPLPSALDSVLRSFDCPVLPMGYESAELAKIAINCCLVGSISVANTLAEICEKIGADWSQIVPALRLDERIGPSAYLAPGLGIAGGNLERDLATLSRFADAHGTDAGVIRSFLANSKHRRNWVFQRLWDTVMATDPDPEIGILGLAYKPGTTSTKNAPALHLIEALAPYRVRVHDPVVKTIHSPHPRLTYCQDPAESWEAADALVVMTPWPDYRELSPGLIATGMRGCTVIDPFALFDETSFRKAGLAYHRLGLAREGHVKDRYVETRK